MSNAPRDVISRLPQLPDGWSPLEIVCDTIVADGLELHRAGLASRSPDGLEITGSAAGVATAPVARAYFELLERASTVEAVARQQDRYDSSDEHGVARERLAAADLFPADESQARYSKSSGIAIHSSWASACYRARCELLERDRVLRSWGGEFAPTLVPIGHSALARLPNYEWVGARFDGGRVAASLPVVVGVFGFPRQRGLPFALGLGAREDEAAATDAAISEALQVLSFLWGEPVPERPPERSPSPHFHIDWYQYAPHQEALRAWLGGAHLRYATPTSSASPSSIDSVFVDLTPAWLGEGYRVAKAYAPTALRLAFGAMRAMEHLPAELRTHPVG